MLNDENWRTTETFAENVVIVLDPAATNAEHKIVFLSFPLISWFHSDINQRDVSQFLWGICVVVPGNPTQRQRWVHVDDLAWRASLITELALLGLQLKKDETMNPKKKRCTAHWLNHSYSRSYINHPLCRSITLAGVKRFLWLPFGRVLMWPYVLAYIKMTSVS